MSLRAGRLLLAIAILSIAGIIVSSVSLYHHYDRSQSSFCDFGGNFNCDIVNRSIYSVVFDVPVALVGIAGYAGLLALATLLRDKSASAKVLPVASLAGLAFALRLTYIEGFVLAAWCAMCLTSLAIIFTIAVISIFVSVRSPQ
jgi:uncharacterized membrane protein